MNLLASATFFLFITLYTDLVLSLRTQSLKEIGANATKAYEAARNFLAERDSPEKVARCIGLPLEAATKNARPVISLQFP